MIAKNDKSVLTHTNEERIVEIAYKMAWNSLTKREQKKFLKLAKEQNYKEIQELAVKITEEVKKIMNSPDYVSRANPYVYLNLKDSE